MELEIMQFTVGSAVGRPVTRSSGICGSCLVPGCMGLPLGLCSEGLGTRVCSRVCSWVHRQQGCYQLYRWCDPCQVPESVPGWCTGQAGLARMSPRAALGLTAQIKVDQPGSRGTDMKVSQQAPKWAGPHPEHSWESLEPN